jgi:hypothetical protein
MGAKPMVVKALRLMERRVALTAGISSSKSSKRTLHLSQPVHIAWLV